MWVLTVLVDRWRSSAISVLERPRAMSVRTTSVAARQRARRLRPVGGRAHDGQARLRAENHAEPGAYHRVVVDDHHPDRHWDSSGWLVGGIGTVARIRFFRSK
jgi:hypothetical protein